VIRCARILLVEDNPLAQQVAAGMLEHVGATVRTADNGQEALARGDLPAQADLGHRLKSSSKMVGAMRFAAMCQSLEEVRPAVSAPAQFHRRFDSATQDRRNHGPAQIHRRKDALHVGRGRCRYCQGAGMKPRARNPDSPGARMPR
jgi:HPt (histidine-containing phosphotransfer) domain-containing protein